MKKFKLKIAILGAALLAGLESIFRPHGAVALANAVELGEVYPSGRKTFVVDPAAALPIATKYLIYCKGAADGYAKLCTAADFPLGPSPDSPKAIGDQFEVNLLGAKPGTFLGISGAAIAFGNELVVNNNSQLIPLPVGAGTYYVVGYAIKSVGGANQEVAFVGCYPRKVTQ